MAKYIKGIDVSGWEPFIDWEQVRKQDIHFVFVKASQGRNRDFTFDRHWEDAKKFGFLRGAYHFIDPRVDAELQARVFLDRLKANGGLGPHDLPPVLDLEDFEEVEPGTGGKKGERSNPKGGGKTGSKGKKDKDAAKVKKGPSTFDAPNSQVIKCAETWLEIVKEETKRTPLIYSRADYFKTRMIGPGGQRPSWSMDYPIWIAHYFPLPLNENLTVPNEADGWPSFTFWQYSEDALMDGVYNDTNHKSRTEVDLNFFKGTLQELFAFVGAPVPDAMVVEVPEPGKPQAKPEVKVVIPVETPPVETPVKTPVAEAITYTIKPGDTISGLAFKFKTTKEAILAANPQITNADFIRIGDTLTIPQA